MVYSPYICSQFVVTMALAPQRPGMVFILKNVHWKIRNFCLLEFNQRLITRKNTLNLTYRKICPLTVGKKVLMWAYNFSFSEF